MAQVSLRDYCDEADSLIQSGEPGKAIRIARHILRHYPRHVESYRLLGQALLKTGNYQEAAEQFWRVLGADPENVASRVGLARIYETTGDLDKAAWQMQRAFELAPANADLRQQLRRLNEARGSNVGDEFEITRAALGRIYARGQLNAKAIQEFRAVLAQEPDRFDVCVALAEVLWRAEQRSEAIEICRRTLERLPNALKLNLILGTTPPDEAATSCLGLAQALDPENVVAQSLFGEKSPLAPLTIKIERLSEVEMEEAWPKPPPTAPVGYVPLRREEEPATDWTTEFQEEEATPMSDKERADEEFELPDWLRGVGDDLLGEEEAQAASVTPAQAGDETPDWLRDLLAQTGETPAPQEPVAAEETPSAEAGDMPDWLQALRPEVPEAASTEAGEPDWLAAIAAGKSLEGAETEVAAPAAPETQADQLDWLNEWEQAEAEAPTAVPTVPAAGEPVAEADEGRALWDQILAEEGVDLTTAKEERPPEAAGMSAEDWLRSTFDQPEAAKPSQPVVEPPAPAPVAEEESPDEGLALWQQILAEEGVDLSSAEESRPPEAAGMSAEEWLRSTFDQTVQPAAGIQKSAEVPPKPEPVAEAPKEEEELPDWLTAAAPPVEEEAVTPPAGEVEPSLLEPMKGFEEGELPDWLREIATGAPAAEPEAAPPAYAHVEVEEEGLPDWLRDFKEPLETVEVTKLIPPEPEPEAAPEAAAEELPDWLQAAEEPAPTLAEPEVAPEAAAEELPDWLQAAEEPAATQVEAAPAAEEGMPDWLRQIAAGEPEPAEEAEPAAPQAETLEQWPKEAPAEAEAEAGELPAWLREIAAGQPEPQPEAEAVPGPAEEVPQAELPAELEEELPSWLRETAAEGAEGEGELAAEMPDWLKMLETEETPLTERAFEKPIELETGEMPEWLGEVMAEESPLAEEWAEAELPEERAPEWLRDLRSEEKAAAVELPAEEAAPEYAPPEAVAETPSAELPDWLSQLREGVIEEAPPPVGEPGFAEEEAEELALPEAAVPEWVEEPVLTEEEAAPVPAEALEVPEAELPAPPVAVPEPVEVAQPAAPVTRPLEPPRAPRLPKEKEKEKEAPVRLEMARAALSAGDWPGALNIYKTLVNSSELLKEVIDNLEQGIKGHPDDPAGHQLLGDAYMKAGRLQDALRAYRTALAKL
jgi:tetratricopeptide (TPR) repeat protein